MVIGIENRRGKKGIPLGESDRNAKAGIPVGKIRGAVERINVPAKVRSRSALRSEEHTSELQSQSNLVCRLLLEKKKTTQRGRSWPTAAPPAAPAVHRPELMPQT